MTTRVSPTREATTVAARQAAPPLPNSNSIRLSWREWAITAFVFLAVAVLLPMFWPATGTQFSRADYRLPSDLSSDYWMFRQWMQYSLAHYPAVILGDSVIWGQYARNDDTLSHHLNALLGRTVFANMGLDGLHPAAMEGMVTYYGGALTEAPVLVHLNPLWLASREQDLQEAGQGETRFNHPKLVAQVLHRPSAYHPTATEVTTALLERQVPFLSWKEHLIATYYGGMALTEWSLENPYMLVPEGRGPSSFLAEDPASPPMPWRERGIEPQDMPWIQPADSYQWHAFQRTIRVLESGGNRVFVLLGPFNIHALTPASQARCQAATAAMAKWLTQEQVPYYAPPVLPTDLYADASHPLGAGYRQLAEELLSSPSFREWSKSWAPDKPHTGGEA